MSPARTSPGVHRGAPAGRHTAADEHGGLEREPVVDLDHRVLRDGGALGERAEHAHRAEVGAAGVEPERAVRHAALEDGGPHVAQVLPARRAVPAGPAVRDEAAHDVVPGLDLGDAGADLLDDAGALVAADDREARGQVPVGQVQVRVAQPRRGVLDQHLTGARAVEVEFHDLERLAGLEQDCSFGLHRCSPRVCRVRGRCSRLWSGCRGPALPHRAHVPIRTA